uniref:Uncharacterized protein n=1 Tax=Heterorhabditis bacteriophora TaxID=37862 RepID=A0A1I7W746_HETBA
MEGKADQIWRVVRRNVANDSLATHVSEFRNLQVGFFRLKLKCNR